MPTNTVLRVPKHVRRRGDAYGQVRYGEQMVLMPAGTYPSADVFMEALAFFAPLEGVVDATLEERLRWFKAKSDFATFEHDRSAGLDGQFEEISITEINPDM